ATLAAELADAAASTPSNLASSVVSSVLAKVQPTTQCGTDDRVNLPGTGMSVANSMYGAALMSGTQCTNYDTINQAGIVWTSVTNVDKTNVNDAKGYSNIGLGKNVKNRLSSISSIPVYYKWERTNTTEFRGNNCFDFITSPTAGLAGDNPGSSEFMLWIAIWGNQVPIGYAQGPIDVVNLFGISWNLYSGTNPGNGVTVRSMLPNSPINGEFSADLKEWLQYMVTKGFIAATDYVNIGNAGSEIFYGNAVMNATTFLTINL
ncbi:concanavalin A-like lectin/glucanase, partial [Thozetella sp. PMI_491]